MVFMDDAFLNCIAAVDDNPYLHIDRNSIPKILKYHKKRYFQSQTAKSAENFGCFLLKPQQYWSGYTEKIGLKKNQIQNMSSLFIPFGAAISFIFFKRFDLYASLRQPTTAKKKKPEWQSMYHSQRQWRREKKNKSSGNNVSPQWYFCKHYLFCDVRKHILCTCTRVGFKCMISIYW